MLSTLANAWAERGERVTLVTLSDEVPDFYALHPSIERIAIHVHGGGLAPAGRRARVLRRILRSRAGARVLSFGLDTNVTSLVAALGTRSHVVVSERTDPRAFRGARHWSALRRVTYRFAETVVVQSEELRPWGARHARSVAVVPNPVRLGGTGGAREAAAQPSPSPFLLAVGRLSREKGFDLLLRALGLVRGAAATWPLLVVGDGMERAVLEQLAASLGVSGRVRWMGTVADPRPLMQAATVFVLPSRVEGFPNALLEAMSVGAPVVSFDCPSGPRQIVTTGVDGLLVAPEDPQALAAAITRLGEDATLRHALGARARDRAHAFALPRVLARWDAVLGLSATGAADADPRRVEADA